MAFDLLVKDNFIPDAEALRADVLARGFSTVHNPADGLDYSGIQIRDPKEFEPSLSALLGFPVRMNTSVARVNFEGETPDNGVHADHSMGELASVIYLTPRNSPLTSTAFWADKITGLAEMPTAEKLDSLGLPVDEFVARIRAQTNNPDKWACQGFVAARLGRIVVYPTQRFHSRWPLAAFGKTPETARLVITSFFDRA